MKPTRNNTAPDSAVDDILGKLDMLQLVIGHLRRGEPVPVDAAKWLADGFEQYIDGGGDIGKVLGVRPRRGGRFHTFASLDKLRRRDELLWLLIYEQPDGTLNRRVARADAFLRDDGPEPVPGFSKVVRQALLNLRLPIPEARRIRAIVGSYTPICRHSNDNLFKGEFRHARK